MQRLPYLALVSLAVVSFALLLSSCGSDSDSGSTPSPTGDPSTPPPSSAARKVVFDGELHGCLYGGVLVETGIDENRNGTLDDDEVDASEAVCNGAPGDDGSDGQDGQDGATGSDGLTSLIKRTVLIAGDANCPAGGEFVETGIDDDGNGTLEASEVDDSAYLCTSLSVLYAESEQPFAFRSEVCPLGFTEGHFGVDANGNGTLDPEEVNVSIPAECYTEAGLVLADDSAATDRWPARNDHSSVVFNGRLWVIGGYDGTNRLNDVWSSEDGVTWEEAAIPSGESRWSARSGHSSVVFNNRMWVIGGFGANRLGDVWSSEDGASWTQVTTTGTSWSARTSHSSVVFDSKLWVLGGFDGNDSNEVWSSPDGAAWTKATISGTSWSARADHTSVVFDGKLWVLGGQGSDHLDDVWSSSDGASWTKATASGHWSARRYHSSVVYDGKMWMLGGTEGTNRLDDVWSSSDGASWTDETPSETHWDARESHSSVVFDDYIWVLGGNDGSAQLNDVWVYAP